MLNRRSSLALGLMICSLFSGCGRYEKVGPFAYEYSKALYSVCNRQDEPRLITVAAQIENAVARSELSAAEATWLQDIVATAQSGDWQVATKSARQLMEAQVEGR